MRRELKKNCAHRRLDWKVKKRIVVKEQGSSVQAKLSQQLILRTESTYIDSSLLGHSAQPTVMVQTGSRHSVVNPLVFLQQV